VSFPNSSFVEVFASGTGPTLLTRPVVLLRPNRPEA
jgi:hypothetical protein